MWRTSIEAVNKYVADEHSSGLWYGEVDMNTGTRKGTDFGSLDAFFAGTLALSGDLDRARRLQDSSYRMWTLYGIEPEELDSIVLPARQSSKGLARAECSLLANGSPRFAGNQVHHTTGDGVLDGRPIEEGQHHAEQRQTLLRVHAAVDRVHQHERILGAETSMAGLLRQDREALALIGRRLQLGKDHRFSRTVQLHRPVASRAHPELDSAGFRTREGQHGFMHAPADAREKREPISRFQRARRQRSMRPNLPALARGSTM